ncbi:NAD(P)/FAD-dependent oxidoreductase [Jatrophihabitans sp. YIM 134969]
MTAPTVIVGGSVAGIRVAQLLRRGGDDGPLIVLDSESGDAYDKPALSKAVLAPGGATPPVLATTVELSAAGVEHRTGVAARRLDLTAKQVVLAHGERVRYGRLVVATGASPRRLPALESESGVHHLRTRDDALALAAAFDGGPRVVVVGGGFIGLEVAAAARSRGLHVTVLEASSHLLQRVLPRAIGHELYGTHRDHGVDVRCGTTVVSTVGDRRVEAVEVADGTVLPADLVVVGVGAVPNTAWLEESSLPISDGVMCTEQLKVSGTDDIWAVGDVARWYNPRYRTLQRVEHWTTAREHASIVAANLLSDRAGTHRSCDAVPYVWSDQFEHRVQHVGVIPPGAITTEVLIHDRRGRLFTHHGADGMMQAATAIDAPFELLQIRRDLQRQRGYAIA